jgi:aspartyl-tRNA(Asn)/glutamyl-tRNA(Gln) amidotransferase subunit C
MLRSGPAMAADGPPLFDVSRVATLASLSLDEAEAARFQNELATIVAYFAQLEQLDTRDVPATAHVQLDRLPVRADEVTPCLSRDQALAAAPSVEGGSFAVPTFVE